MLSLRVIFVALAVVCAAQAYSVDYDVIPVESYAASDIFNKVVEVLQKARERIKDLDRKLKEAVDKAYEKVQAAADKMAARWNQVIQKLVDKANQYGVDVSECLSEKNGLKEIVDKTVQDSRQCIANEEPVIEEVQKKLDALLVQQENLLEAAKQAVQKCEGLPLIQAVLCNLANLRPIAAEAVQVLASTGAVAGEIAVISVKSAAKIRSCVNEVYKTQGQAAKQVVDKATQCIREKIQGSKSLY